jgi:hypothetical protein
MKLEGVGSDLEMYGAHTGPDKSENHVTDSKHYQEIDEARLGFAFFVTTTAVLLVVIDMGGSSRLA